MNQEQRRSLDILTRCLNLRAGTDDPPDDLPNQESISRQQRLDDPIGNFVCRQRPAMECADGWYFCVPSSFRSALDISLTARIVGGKVKMRWTQGSWFHFEEGDTIYESVKAYQAWHPKNVRVCLDIHKASPAKPVGANVATRIAGTVILDILTPNAKQTQLEKRKQIVVTQDEFVRLLILGPPNGWNEFLPINRAARNDALQRRLPF